MLKERVKMVQEERAIEKIDRKLVTKTRVKKQNVQKSLERKEETRAETKFQCRRCNRKHGPRECPAFGKKCNRCGKLNHFETAYRVKGVQEIKDSENEEKMSIESAHIVKGEVYEMCVSA